MELIKKLDEYKTWNEGTCRVRLHLFKCPVCGRMVKRKMYEGIHAGACSRKCNGRLQADQYTVPYETVYEGVTLDGLVRKVHHNGASRYFPAHPRALNGWVPEHRVVFELASKRYVRGYEHVHHVNGCRTDNRPENIKVIRHEEYYRRPLVETEKMNLKAAYENAAAARAAAVQVKDRLNRAGVTGQWKSSIIESGGKVSVYLYFGPIELCWDDKGFYASIRYTGHASDLEQVKLFRKGGYTLIKRQHSPEAALEAALASATRISEDLAASVRSITVPVQADSVAAPRKRRPRLISGTIQMV